MAAHFLEQYEPLDVIGNGSFGIIRKVRRNAVGMLLVSPCSLIFCSRVGARVRVRGEGRGGGGGGGRSTEERKEKGGRRRDGFEDERLRWLRVNSTARRGPRYDEEGPLEDRPAFRVFLPPSTMPFGA